MTTTAPRAERRPHVHAEHGVERQDPWAWLRDKEDPAVLGHLAAENAHTEARLAHLEPLRKALYAEMLGRVKEDDASVPAPRGEWVWWRRTEAGRPYGIELRRPKAGGAEQVVLDANVVGAGHDYVSVVPLEPSPDGRILAFATDFAGDERYAVRFRDLETGADLPDVVPVAAAQIAWAADGKSVWWTEMDDSLRSFRIRLHVLGSTGEDPVVWEEPEEEQRVFLDGSTDGSQLMAVSFNHGCIQILRCDASAPGGPVVPLTPRIPHVRHKAAYAAGRWFVATDADGQANYRLCEVPGGDPDPSTWRTVIPCRADVEIVDLLGLDRWLVVLERERGQLHVRALELAEGADPVGRRMPLPEEPCVLELGPNFESDTDLVRIRYTSMTAPATDLELDLRAMTTTVLKQTEVPGYDPKKYVTSRLEVPTKDGVSVPVSVVHRADVDPTKGPRPLVLYGYGSYGLTVDPVFASPRVSLLDRGVVFAIAHVRGGGFLGRSWYLDGKLEKKANTFDDFVAVLDRLHALGWSTPESTVIMGGSAGGLLVGAVLNRAPDRMKAAVALVPFVDVVTTMLDESIPLTTGEWKEWGDPRQKAFFDVMHAYSPYDNVTAQVYPDVLVVAGLNDPRVAFWEPAKWVQKLRATATGGEVLLKMHMGAGHQGRSGRYGYLEDRAFEFAWILEELGLTGAAAPGSSSG